MPHEKSGISIGRRCALALALAAATFGTGAWAQAWPTKPVQVIVPGRDLWLQFVVMAGTFGGTFIASRVPTTPLAIFFACFMAYVSIQLQHNISPKPSRELPGTLVLSVAGVGIGDRLHAGEHGLTGRQAGEFSAVAAAHPLHEARMLGLAVLGRERRTGVHI